VECSRRDAADRARARRDAERGAWLDAAQAQWVAAEAYCSGNLYSPYGLAELARVERASGLAAAGNGLALWRGSDGWAEKRASRELLNFWAASGGRLSWARWQSDQAAQARAYRGERELERMAAVVPASVPEVPARVPVASLADRIDAMASEMRARVDSMAARMLAELRGVVA
jgi:hypothetical protein